jgi:hypothetical protein
MQRGIIEALITDAHGPDAADAWAKFIVQDEDKRMLEEAGKRVLHLFPGRTPGACTMMSAVYSVVLDALGARPSYVIAGSLYVGDQRVFGEDGPINGRERFSQSDSSWDGHAWIIYGDWLADASIFRTADSKGSPPALAAHVGLQFGSGRGLYAAVYGRALEDGFRYEPQYVLTTEQAEALARGAHKTLIEPGSKR